MIYKCKTLNVARFEYVAQCYICACNIFSVVPEAAGNVNIVPSFHRLNVTWDPPTVPNGIITQYTAEWKKDSDSNYNSTITTSRRYTIDNLQPQHLYCVRVAPSTSIGQGPFTEEKCANTNVSGTCMSIFIYIYIYTPNIRLADAPNFEWSSLS